LNRKTIYFSYQYSSGYVVVAFASVRVIIKNDGGLEITYCPKKKSVAIRKWQTSLMIPINLLM